MHQLLGVTCLCWFQGTCPLWMLGMISHWPFPRLYQEFLNLQSTCMACLRSSWSLWCSCSNSCNSRALPCSHGRWTVHWWFCFLQPLWLWGLFFSECFHYQQCPQGWLAHCLLWRTDDVEAESFLCWLCGSVFSALSFSSTAVTAIVTGFPYCWLLS